MVDAETLDMMSQIEAFVSDNLQVVSYKWLSRKFSVSSNEAKRLLKEFVETHEDGLEVIYTLSGWLKDSSTSYHIKLVSAPKLSDARKEFEDNCSVQVYSVQACIPKDPAALWNAEFVQSEELFNQPSNVDNCLWDNRWGLYSRFLVCAIFFVFKLTRNDINVLKKDVGKAFESGSYFNNILVNYQKK